MAPLTQFGRASIRHLLPLRRALRLSMAVVGGVISLVAVLSLVPGDGAYYRVERILSKLPPLGAASQQLRSIPATAASLMTEPFQDRTLQVEGVKINLEYAVNPLPNVMEQKFDSQVLDEERTYWVYLPPGYEESNDTYPTLFLLHGMSQGHRWWTEVARIDRIATAMIESGKIRPMIIVMPNGNRVERDFSTTSLYDDHCDTGLDFVARTLKAIGDRLSGLRIYKISCDGDFEDYIVREMVEEVGSKYRSNGQRYLGGFSIGGRAALQLALGNDAVFDGVFGLSGNYDFLRRKLSDGEMVPSDGMKVFLASGNKDQRGVYGELNTFLFHKDLAGKDIDHLYCTYDGTHSNLAWISAMPQALQYLLPIDGEAVPDTDSCQGL